MSARERERRHGCGMGVRCRAGEGERGRGDERWGFCRAGVGRRCATSQLDSSSKQKRRIRVPIRCSVNKAIYDWINQVRHLTWLIPSHHTPPTPRPHTPPTPRPHTPTISPCPLTARGATVDTPTTALTAIPVTMTMLYIHPT